MDEENKIEPIIIDNYAIYNRIENKGLSSDFLAINRLN